MTLIITLLSGDYILQASDRRVTWRDPHTGAITFADDYRNKAILYCNRFTITYTGAADVAPDGTDRWLGRHFAQHVHIAAGANALPEALRAEFQASHLRSRRLSVLMAGWRYEGGAALPYVRVLQNFDSSTRQLYSEGGDTFLSAAQDLGPGRFLIGHAGVRIPRPDWTGFTRLMSHAGRRHLTVDTFLGLMVREIRRVADQTSAVGKSIMLTVLPRAAATVEDGDAVMVTTGGPNTGDGATFHYVPEDRNEKILYGPHFTCHGVLMTDFEGGALTSGSP